MVRPNAAVATQKSLWRFLAYSVNLVVIAPILLESHPRRQ